MAHQSTPDVVDFACQTVADLTVLPRTALSDGCRSWVSAAGATHGLWCLDDNSAAAVDNLTVVATSDGVGRWIYFGFAATPMAVNISVNTEALLSAVGVVAFLDGALAFVGNPAGGVGQSQDSTWQLVTQVGAVPALSAHEVIASSAAGRVWQRLLDIQTPRWAQQITWYIDPVGGNDQSAGTVGDPLLTWAEFARRMPVAATAYTVNILGNLAATDPISWMPRIEWSRQLSATKPSITIVGTETVAANGVFAAGATLPVVNVASQFTVAAHGAWATGRAVRNTTAGARFGALAFVSLDMGAGQAECSPWWLAATFAEAAAPLLNDTFNEITWSTAPEVLTLGITTVLQKLDIALLSFGVTSVYQLNECRAPVSIPAVGTAQLFNGCHCKGGAFSIFVPVLATYVGSFVDRTATTNPITLAGGGVASFLSTLIRGNAAQTTEGIRVGRRSPSGTGSIGGPGRLGLRRTQYFNLGTAVTSGVVAVMGNVDIEDFVSGSGNAALGGAAFEVAGGDVRVKTNIIPTVTGAVELLVDGAANQIPPLVAGALVPAAAPLTTWVQWNGVGFVRFFTGNGTGSVIANTP